MSQSIDTHMKEIWQPHVDASQNGARGYAKTLSSMQGTQLLAAIKDDARTAMLLRLSESLQRSPDISQYMIDKLAVAAEKALDALTRLADTQPDRISTAQFVAKANACIRQSQAAFHSITEAPFLWQRTQMDASLNIPLGLNGVIGRALAMFDEHVGRALEQTPPSERDALKASWEAQKDDFSHFLWHIASKEGNAQDKARCLAACAEDYLRRQFGPRQHDIPEQAAPRILQSSTGQLLLARQAQVENLVFSGGGGRGFGYAETLRLLRENHALDHVNHVAGSSAGAMMAVATAFNIGNSAVAGKTLMDFAQMAQKSTADQVISHGYEGLAPLANAPIENVLQRKIASWAARFIHFTGETMTNGAGVVKTFDKATAESAANFLHTHLPSARPQNFTEREWTRLQQLRDAINPHGELNVSTPRIAGPNDDVTQAGAVTFADIGLLRRLPQGSAHFKELTVTAWDATAGEVRYLDARSTPNMPVALAVRMSMAIPPLFRGIRDDLSRYAANPPARRQAHLYYDGGIGSNIPTEIFLPKQAPRAKGTVSRAYATAASRTLTFLFDEGGKAMGGLHLHKFNGRSTTNSAFLSIMGVTDVFGRANFNNMKEQRDKQLDALGNNVLVVGHGMIGLGDLQPDDETTSIASAMARVKTQEWLDNIKDQSDVLAITDAADALTLLSEDEKDAFVRAYAQRNEHHAAEDALFTLLGGPERVQAHAAVHP